MVDRRLGISTTDVSDNSATIIGIGGNSAGCQVGWYVQFSGTVPAAPKTMLWAIGALILLAAALALGALGNPRSW